MQHGSTIVCLPKLQQVLHFATVTFIWYITAAALSDAWTSFSAVCWLYGKMLNQRLGYPIGLIDTSWGGTPIEAWMSPPALANCGLTDNRLVIYANSMWHSKYSRKCIVIFTCTLVCLLAHTRYSLSYTVSGKACGYGGCLVWNLCLEYVHVHIPSLNWTLLQSMASANLRSRVIHPCSPWTMVNNFFWALQRQRALCSTDTALWVVEISF